MRILLSAFLLFSVSCSVLAQDVRDFSGGWQSIQDGCKPHADEETESGLSFYDTSLSWTETSCEIKSQGHDAGGITLNLACTGPEGNFKQALKVLKLGPGEIFLPGENQIFTDLRRRQFVRCTDADGQVVPSFEKYPAKAIKKKSTLPKLNGDGELASRYRTRILAAMKLGPNFAGQFTMVEIGCGTASLNYLVANSATGRVALFPIGTNSGQTIMGIDYRSNSKLVVVDWMNYPNGACYSETLAWEDSGIRLISKMKTGTGLDACMR